MVYYFCLWKRRCKRIGCISFLVLEVLAASWVSCMYDAGIRILGMVWCDEAAVLILPNRNKGSPILCHEWCRSLLALPHAQHTTQNQVTGEVHHWSRISSLFLICASLTLNYFPLSWSVFACTLLVVLQSSFLGAFSHLWFINQNSEFWTVRHVLSRQCLLLRMEVSELSGRNYYQWHLDQHVSLSPSDHDKVSDQTDSNEPCWPPSSCVA